MQINKLNRLSRRRVLFIGAMAAGSAALPAFATPSPDIDVQNWHGIALGADASIALAGVPDERAQSLFKMVETELARLESIFSLYKRDSVVSQLNARGSIDLPPPELLELLSIASSVHHQTNGLFDPSVQPLFALYAEHFSQGGAASGPAAERIANALSHVGFSSVEFSTTRVSFGRTGMALTLNGIAQGFISDKIAALLRAQGLENVLVNMGEIVALGTGLTGTGWRVGINPVSGVPAEVLSVSNQAVATSAVNGTVLDAGGTVGHIFHPREGRVRAAVASVTIVDSSAARADALSTAASLMSEDEIAQIKQAGVKLYI